MKDKKWIPLVLAVVLGVAALVLTRSAMSKRGSSNAGEAGEVATVVAARDIEAGHGLGADDLVVKRVPAASAPAGSFQTTEELLLRVTSTKLTAGQPVTSETLTPAANGIQALVPTGMRAITLQINEFSGLGGMLQPGARVDVIAVVRNDPQDGSVARAIVQNVEVRAVGRQLTAATETPADPSVGGPVVNHVTLLVTPAQAEALQLASVGGQPWLVLRNVTDTAAVTTDGTSLADLRGDANRKPGHAPVTEVATATATPSAEPVLPRTRTVKIIRATKVEDVQVEVGPQPPAGWMTNTDASGATEAE